jgi:membrane protein DedA with SNARE-associated domain
LFGVEIASITSFIEGHEDWALVLMFVLLALESFGLPLPGETALIACSVLASQGTLQIEWVVLIGIAAAIIGDNLGYVVARTGGRKLLYKHRISRGYAEKYLPRGERFFARHGGKTVFIGRFVAVLRVTSAWTAGISRTGGGSSAGTPPAASSGRPASRSSRTTSATRPRPRSAATACSPPAAR